ncbi:MAG: YhcH/YjgK/YiaL family protein [Pseudoflavonifractor sp.]|nr:YhcH/YjgK/YiaL family protein [Pseudoflavonifractor sp.]
MIYTKRDCLSRYKGLSASLDTAIDFLASADLTKLAMGRNDVDGDTVFINRFDYTTMPEESASWEGHKYYADIHVVLEGEERIGVTDAASLTAGDYDAAGDFIPYEGPVDAWVTMRPGDILVVFPEDVHMVKVQLKDACPVKKAVFKVKV